jgi:hypothetical protein
MYLADRLYNIYCHLLDTLRNVEQLFRGDRQWKIFA